MAKSGGWCIGLLAFVFLCPAAIWLIGPGISLATADVTSDSAKLAGGPDDSAKSSTPSDYPRKEQASQAGEKKEKDQQPPPNNTPKNSDAIKSISIMGEILPFLSAIIMHWTFVALVVLIYFRDSIKQILDAIAVAMADRGVTIDAPGGVKLQIAERAIEATDDCQPFSFSSPFEIEAGPSRDSKLGLGDIRPQLKFPVSDSSAEYWAKINNTGSDAKVTAAYLELKKACGEERSTFSSVRPKLVGFSRVLEEARFLKSNLLVEVLDKLEFLRTGIESSHPDDTQKEADDFLILRCSGVAYAQCGKWDSARKMVSNIAWKDGCPHYLPASDIWLISEYHCQLLEQWPNGPDLCLDSPDFVKAVNAILDKGYQLLSEMRPEEWNSFATLASPLGYYKRLLLRAIGSLAGVLGDYSDNPNDKDRYYGKAEVARQECAKIIGNDNPSPLDHNNLADLYQQRNQCKEAHEEINRAIAEQQSFKDPMFYNTRAMIYWRENKYLEGMFALEEYRDADAKTPSTSATDVVQFVDNQILAAKLAVASDPTCSAPYWALATTKLENVRRFINVPEIRQKIETNKNVAKCLIEIDDLLGYAYMQQPGWEVSALEVFDRLESVGALAAPGGMGWQRRLKSAKNLARLARLQRRSCSSKMAAKYREQASNELTDSEVAIKQLPLDNGLKVSQRIRNLTVRLDTVTTMIDVAEETFSEGAFKEAQLLLEKMDPILLSLRSSLESDLALQHSLGDQLNTIRSQILLSEAQRSFLHGRILIGLDPSFGGADLIPKAEDSLNAARGVNPNLDCGIDLVLGQMMLTVALAGKGDAQFWYRRAVTFLELAVTRDAPSFRAEAIKALADAYAKRSVVLRKATSKASASAKTP